MKRVLRPFIVSLLLSGLIGLASGTASSAGSPFMDPGSLRPGTRGKVLTVFSGTRIESFQVEFIGLTAGMGAVANYMMVRVYGPALSKAGGIASGMSGSPVYFDGRLAGALSYVFSNADPHYGLVTPIQDMVRVWDYDAKNTARAGNESGGSSALPPGAVPIQTPVLIRGLGARAMGVLNSALANFGPLQGQPAARTEKVEETVRLEPGSPLGVQLARGDVDATAVGTLTWIGGDRFVGFGHPFLNIGGSALIASTAFIHRTVPSRLVPFKLATAGRVVGTVSQDRPAGVAGRLGPAPSLLPIEVAVFDASSGRRTTIQAEVVIEESLTPALASTIALEGLDRCLDRVGAGTARVRMTIETLNHTADISRENLFYHRRDVAASAVGEVEETLRFLLGNEFIPVMPVRVSIEAEVRSDTRTATVVGVQGPDGDVRPGEAFEIKISLRPFRGGLQTVPVTLTMPADAAPGTVTVSVRGGYRGGGESDDESEESPEIPGQTFEEALRNLAGRPRNDEAVIAFSVQTRKTDGDGDKQKAVQSVQTVTTTAGCGFVVRGRQSVRIQVIAGAEPPAGP